MKGVDTMIIKFSEVVVPFENLSIGTVIGDGKGRRYMKIAITSSGSWVPSRPTTKGSLTNSEMRDKVEPNWHVWL